MRTILLTQGKIALIDDIDYELVSNRKWHYNDNGYARTSNPKLYMHRLIMKPRRNLQIDHIDGNRLNNQRANLRVVVEANNHLNIARRKDNKSGFRGVSWSKEKNKWVVCITKRGVTKHIGYFTSRIEAALAYNLVATKLHGKFARLNEVSSA